MWKCNKILRSVFNVVIYWNSEHIIKGNRNWCLNISLRWYLHFLIKYWLLINQYLIIINIKLFYDVKYFYLGKLGI